MHVISEKKLRDFWATHSEAEGPLRAWHQTAERSNWEKSADVHAVYGQGVDQVGKFTVFNIGGNKYRLIAVIHFNRAKVYIRHILTHAEYDQGKWKDD